MVSSLPYLGMDPPPLILLGSQGQGRCQEASMDAGNMGSSPGTADLQCLASGVHLQERTEEAIYLLPCYPRCVVCARLPLGAGKPRINSGPALDLRIQNLPCSRTPCYECTLTMHINGCKLTFDV